MRKAWTCLAGIAAALKRLAMTVTPANLAWLNPANTAPNPAAQKLSRVGTHLVTPALQSSTREPLSGTRAFRSRKRGCGLTQGLALDFQ